jgi:hypothetical protein
MLFMVLLHYPGRSEEDGNKVTITNAATEFHVYKTESYKYPNIC